MAKITKESIVAKLKEMPEEDRLLFREALSEVEPNQGLQPDEVLAIREMLRGSKDKPPKKAKSFLEWLAE